ncbi:MAG: mycothiol synthase [Myxococcota bacterium]
MKEETMPTLPLERDETLALRWPPDASPPPPPDLPRGYTLRVGVDRAAFASTQAAIGFEVTDAAWSRLVEQLAAGAMVFAETTDTHEPVAVAAAEHCADGWVEPGWVAVAPVHRGAGLGLAVCTALTRHLLSHGHHRLIGSTQDHRLAALRIYLTLGFQPVLRPEKAARWQAVMLQV